KPGSGTPGTMTASGTGSTTSSIGGSAGTSAGATSTATGSVATARGLRARGLVEGLRVFWPVPPVLRGRLEVVTWTGIARPGLEFSAPRTGGACLTRVGGAANPPRANDARREVPHVDRFR